MMTLYIALAALGVAIVALAVMAVKRVIEDGRVKRIWRSLDSEPTGEVFREEMVADLPAPARRYLLHAIKPGTPLAQSVQLKMIGALRPGGAEHWTRMRADEIVAVPRGFVWRASVRGGRKRVHGADYYCDGQAKARFWLWGLIPVVNMEGPDTTKSAAGRLAIEAIWLPSSLLPQAGARWEAADNQSARVTLEIGDESATLTLSVAPDGRLRGATISRWCDATESGEPDYVPFRADIEEEREFQGYTIPSSVATGWWVRPDYYLEFFKASVLEAKYR